MPALIDQLRRRPVVLESGLIVAAAGQRLDDGLLGPYRGRLEDGYVVSGRVAPDGDVVIGIKQVPPTFTLLPRVLPARLRARLSETGSGSRLVGELRLDTRRVVGLVLGLAAPFSVGVTLSARSPTPVRDLAGVAACAVVVGLLTVSSLRRTAVQEAVLLRWLSRRLTAPDGPARPPAGP